MQRNAMQCGASMYACVYACMYGCTYVHDCAAGQARRLREGWPAVVGPRVPRAGAPHQFGAAQWPV
eukprot:9218280-Lingulodinium_polyedra.AAC.1